MKLAVFIDNIIESCCRCCNKCCKKFSNFFDYPFSCWAVFCIIILIPGAIIAFIFAGRNWALDYCDNNLHTGLLLIGFFYLIQNFANFYIVYRYAQEYGKNSNPNNKLTKGICAVTAKFLCYDFVMCFYIIFAIFAIVWCSLYIDYASVNTRICKSNFT